jgi:serine/threonine protein kinase
VLYASAKVTLVFEYVPHDLNKVISSLPKGEVIHPVVVKSFMRQILSAVDYCHKKRIFHRDLSLSNILFYENQVLKIIDFGLASIFDLPAQPRTKKVVTCWFRAPELFFGQEDYSAPVDIWSVGCIFAYMVQSMPLFQC